MISNTYNDVTTNTMNRYDGRNHTMQAQLHILPLELVNLVISYCTFEFERTNLNYCTRLLSSNAYSCCVTLKNGTIAIGYSSGLICLWDPQTDKFLKQLHTLKNIFDAVKYYLTMND